MLLETRVFDDGLGGTVSGVVATPAGSGSRNVPLVVLAHGAGGDMHSPLLTAVHQALADRGCLSVKFNFPYKERGRSAPDPAPRLERCFRTVLEAVRAENEPRIGRVFIGGKSLGGRMATHLAAQGTEVDGVILLGYPLHPPGKPERARVAHLPAIKAPMLFFAGTRDPLCNLDLLRRTLDTLTAPITLHVVPDGDHSFDVLKRTGRGRDEVWAEIVDVTGRWIAERSSQR